MEGVSDEQLFELFKLVNPSATTLEDYKKTVPKDSYRYHLFWELMDYVSDTDYKGPLEYESIKNYFMGMTQVMNKNRELLKELPIHAKKLREYHKTKHEEQSFNEWKEQESLQKEVVENIMDKLIRNPTHWRIDFSKLTNTGRELIFEPLKNFFIKHILTLPIIGKYKLQYKVNGEWHSKPLDEESLNQLMKNLEEKHLIFDLDSTPAEYFYEEGGSKLPDWSIFDEIRFSEYQKAEVNNDRGGSFFRYLIKPDTHRKIIEYLKRLQIFETLVDTKKKTQREELNDNCFVYALKQTGQYDEEILNRIRMRINRRYLSQGCIEQICSEFNIQLKLTFINEEARDKKKTVTSSKNRKSKNYLGVDHPEPNRKHHFNIFESHYFIEETTPFSTDYINHLKERTEEQFDKQFDRTWRKARRFISSSNLVRVLMQNGFFKPYLFW